MENIISYYYNFYPETVSKRYGGYYFENKDLKYLLVELIVSSKEVLDIYEKLMSNNIRNYLIVYNKDNALVSTLDNKNYILFILNCMPNEILKFNEQFFIPISYQMNWSKLWSNRIDYYEIQINELAQDKRLILHSVYYYIGLAENAIYIADKYEEQVKDECSIQHYRMRVPVTKGEYFNPANMLIDVSIRDIAEYIKSSFFLEKRDFSYYVDYIKNLNLTDITANLLLARLLYPTYYFDLFDEIILNDYDENSLIPIINIQKNYELFLKEVYNLISQRYQIININWLRKQL